MARIVMFIMFFTIFYCCLLVKLSQSEGYISWTDIELISDVPGARLNSRDEKSRVIVVDKNGGGDSLTVQGAVDLVPQHNSQRVKIYIRPGIYREKVLVPYTKPYISFVGNESYANNTVITWNDKASDIVNGSEIGTYGSATVSVESDYFCATAITFENTIAARPGDVGRQGVALRVSSRKAFFYKARMLGAQDTLLSDIGMHYFFKCYIQGNVDFIFGSAKALFQDCVVQSIATTNGAIAAHRRDSLTDDTGFSFVHCDVKGTGKVFLGRAWGPYSRIIYSYCTIEDIITPLAWSDWNIPDRQKTVVFGEFKCVGRGASTIRRVPWARSFTFTDVKTFLDIEFINGNQWLRL